MVPNQVRIAAPLILAAVLFIVKRVVLARMHAAARRTDASLGDVLVSSVDLPINLVILVASLYMLLQFLPVEARWLEAGRVAFRAALAFGFFFVADRLLTGLINSYATRVETLARARGILRGVLHAVIIIFFLMVLFDLMGMSITPLVASLGVGSLAVALALQDTLSNFFAGLYAVADKPIQVGDFIRLENGEEGFVIEVGWRSTRVQMLGDSVVIIPNNKLMGSVLTNHSLPDPEVSVPVQVGVGYKSDLAHVERVTCEVARQVMQTVGGAAPGHEPIVRFHTFDASSINLSVSLRAKTFVDQYLLRHEFIKALHERYKQEGIVIPFPMRTLDLPADLLEQVSRRAASPRS
jgi:small-conductance mechanosensitive channel